MPKIAHHVVTTVLAALLLANCGDKVSAPTSSNVTDDSSMVGDLDGVGAGPDATGPADADASGAEAPPVDSAETAAVPEDAQPPTISFKNPVNGSNVAGTFAVEVDAADDIGVISVEYRLNGATVYTASKAPFGWPWDTTAFASGNWYLSAIAKDAAGKTSKPAGVEVKVSNKAANCGDPPQVKLIYPTDKAVVCGDLAIQTAASGPCGVVKVEFFIDEEKIGEASLPPYKTAWKTQGLKDGQHFVKTVATDAAKQASQQTILVKIDNKQLQCVNPPTVFLAKPVDNAYVFGKVAIEAEASAGGDGAAIVEVSFSIDGSSIGKASTSPWVASWDSDAKAEGSHTLKAITKDSFDNLGVHQITLTVDRTEPTVNFAAPDGDANLNGDVTPVTVAAEAADNVGLVGVSFAATKAGTSNPSLLGIVKAKPWQVNWATADSSSGDWTLTATAMDAAGHTSKTTRTVTLDRPPTIAWGKGWQTGKPLTGKITISGLAEDDLGIQGSVKVWIDGQPVSASSDGNKYKQFTYEWDTALAPYGEHELVAEAEDSGGHKAMATIKVQTDQPLAMSVDVCAADWQGCKAPAVDPATEYTGKVYLKVQSNDDNAAVKSVELQVDGSTVQTLLAAPWQFAWDSAGVKDGPHELGLKVTTSLPESKSVALGLAVNNCDLDHDKQLASNGVCSGDDCNDAAADVYAGATDAVGNGTDDNCDGLDGVDADGDKVASQASGGQDCDDNSKTAYPCADELAAAATDSNCDGKLAASCDDCQACSLDLLSSGKCVHVAIAEGGECSDGSACTVGEIGGGAVCANGQAKNCDDANACTNDSCDGIAGCTNTPAPKGLSCDLDASQCTPDTCAAGSCILGIGPYCQDNDVCTADSCNPLTGKCVYQTLAIGTNCDDGDPCTLGDGCATWGCLGVPKACGATEVCDAGACVELAPPGMVLIGAGTFLMGCVPGDAGCDASEKPQHELKLPAFYMDVYEVTVAAYKKCVAAGACGLPLVVAAPYNWLQPGKELHPVNGVNASMAAGYCKWAGRRLPTEAEWEKAARGGLTGMKYPWGDTSPTCNAANANFAVMSDEYPGPSNGCGKEGTWKVGSGKYKNGYGLSDMSGNVSEWVSDWYDVSYYSSSPSSNPQGPASTLYRIARGGGYWDGPGKGLRASYRAVFFKSHVFHTIGFRCAKSIP